jgi:hypothetical protein
MATQLLGNKIAIVYGAGADGAVFLASDRADAMTGATLNLSCGTFVD